MKTKLLFLGVIMAGALAMVSCTTNNVSSSDLAASINGPNSIKGTFTGKMIDSTKTFSFAYDYHVTTNDGGSASEGYVDTNTGDTLLWIWQNFYFDRNGYDDSGDNLSASGQYVYLEFQVKVSTVKNVTTLTMLPKSNSDGANQYMYGMWQNILPSGARFVYGTLHYYSYVNYSVPPTLEISGLAYDKNSQILSGKMNMALADGNDVQNYSGNSNAATITGDFKIYVPKEHFQVLKKTSDYGNVYRKGAR